MSVKNKTITLIISGGIAAYKILGLIRLLKKAGAHITPILTKSATEFVTPLSVGALAESPVYQNLFDLKDETDMGHIRLSRESDLILVAPASANIIAKMAHGLADDLATTCLLAADCDILVAPAMNPYMWDHPATQDNLKTLESRGVHVIQPDSGEMACGEVGQGRLPDEGVLFSAIESHLSTGPLTGKKAIVTAGPTFEPIDPVRFIGNHSSGKQGYAIAEALRDAGADVTLISGPTALNDPRGMDVVRVQTAAQMLDATLSALPADIAVCTAAVCDWAPVSQSDQKLKKAEGSAPPSFALQENPDILKNIANHANRPALVVGFAAETENIIDNAKTKLLKKKCNYICANNVADDAPVFGADNNQIHIVSETKTSTLERASKRDIAKQLVQCLIEDMG